MISIVYPPHVSNRLTIHNQEAVTVYATCGIYRASAVTSCSHVEDRLFQQIKKEKYILLVFMKQVLLEEHTDFQLVNKFPAFYGTRRFIAAFRRACYPSLFSAIL